MTEEQSLQYAADVSDFGIDLAVRLWEVRYIQSVREEAKLGDEWYDFSGVVHPSNEDKVEYRRKANADDIIDGYYYI